jgi:hypothetical protein
MKKDDSTYPAFTGDLAEPLWFVKPAIMQVYEDDHPAVKEAMHSENLRMTKEVLRKLDLLIDHYKVERSNPYLWQMVVFRMAKQFIPGFQITARPVVGAPLDWGPVELAGLFLEVEALTKQGMSAMDACRTLLRAQDGSWRYPRCRSAKTIYRRYQQSKKSAYVRLMTEPESDLVRQLFRESVIESLSESATDS